MAKWGTRQNNSLEHCCNECGYLLDDYGECQECILTYIYDGDMDDYEDCEDPMTQQVGGSHYRDMNIQPIEFILANELGFCEGNIIKYTCRYKQKNGVEDLRKVIHYAEMLIANIEEQQED
jgi:hypothetical protein